MTDPHFGTAFVEPTTSAETYGSVKTRKRLPFFLRLRGGDDEFSNVAEKRNIRFSLNTFEAAVLIFKAALHGSFLLLPWAFARIGHVFGFIGLFVLYLAVFGAIRILVTMAHALTKRTETAQLSYGDVAEQTVLSRFPESANSAFGFRIFVDVVLFLSLFVTACIYIVETSNFLRRAIQDSCIQVWLVILLLGLLLILLAFINQLKWLVPLCLIGCLCIIVGAIFAVVAFYSHVLQNSFDDNAVVSDVGEWPYYFGSVPFTVTWIYVILPIENDARAPLNIVVAYCSPWVILLVFVIVLHSLIGFLGFDVIGPGVAANVLSQYFVAGDSHTVLSFYLIAIGVFLTINLLILIAAKILWFYLKDRVPRDNQTLVNLLLAPLIMLVCVGLALGLQKFCVVLAMLCTLTVGLVSFIFPPVLNFIMTPEPETQTSKVFRFIFNICLLIVGIGVIFCGFPTDYRLWDDNDKVDGEFMEH